MAWIYIYTFLRIMGCLRKIIHFQVNNNCQIINSLKMKHYLLLFFFLQGLCSLSLASDTISKYFDKISSLDQAGSYDSISYYLPIIYNELKNTSPTIHKAQYYAWHVLVGMRTGDTGKSYVMADSIEFIIDDIRLRNKSDSTSIIYVYNNLASIRLYQFRYEKAYNYFEKAIDFAQKQRKTESITNLYQNFGLVKIKMGYVEDGLNIINEALLHFESAGDLEGKIGCADVIGTTLTDYKNFNLAKKYFDIATSSIDSTVDDNWIYAVYNDLGRMYNFQEKYDSSLVYFSKSMEYAKKINDPFMLSILNSNIGEVQLKLGKYDDAEINLRKGLSGFEELNVTYAQAYLFNLLAYLYYSTGDMAKAGIFQQKTDNLLEETELDASLLLDIYKRSYEIEKKLNNYKKSLEYLEKHNILADSLKNNLLTWQVNEMENRLHVSRIENDNIKKDIQLRKNQKFLTTIISVSIVLIIITGFIYYRRFKEKQLFKLRNELLIEEHEKNMVQMQLMLINNRLSPHLISNLFYDIHKSIEQGENEKSLELLEHISRLIVSSFTHTDSIVVSLRQEITFITSYIEVRRPALGDFAYNIDIPEEAMSINIPSLMIQLFVENAIKHGLLPKQGEKKLDISAEMQNEILHIYISDNGIGREKAKELHTYGTGMGLFILTKMSTLLNEVNDQNIKWITEDIKDRQGLPAGTKVSVEIPVNFKYI